MKETVASDAAPTMRLRVTDSYNVPVENLAMDLVELTPSGENAVGKIQSGALGLVRFTRPPGLYSVRFTITGVAHRIGFFAHPDEVGGLGIRIPGDLDAQGK